MLATTSTAFWYSTRATGIVALILLTATMVLGILTAGRVKSRSWPAFAQAELHKRISVMAMVFVAIHVLTSVLDTYVHLGWLSIVVPFSSSYEPFWTGLGTVAVDLMIAVAGPAPLDGWAVGIASECTTAIEHVDQVVSITSGGLATSGTTARSWERNGRTVHHIIDPWTGAPAPAVWSLVSTTASSCVEANAWSTAAVVWGEDAPGNLAALGVCARLVRPDGEVVRIGGWPVDAVDTTGGRSQ